MIWQDDPEEEAPEATWEEYSVLFKQFYQYLTFSEFDQIERPVMWQSICDTIDPAADDKIVYVSNYSIYTHKGDYFSRKSCLGFPSLTKARTCCSTSLKWGVNEYLEQRSLGARSMGRRSEKRPIIVFTQ